TDQDPDVDARVANNGNITSQAYFHTAVEVDPWWQVDLGELFLIEKVIIYNRNDVKGRLKKFTILGSTDGQDWFSLFQKIDESIFSVFAVNITNSTPVRFVRVRHDGYNCLHFRECQIFAKPVSLGS